MNIVSSTARQYVSSHALAPILGTITHVRTNEPVAALTFDDGPHPYYTPILVDLLAQHNAKATFFMIGEVAQKYKDVVRQVIEHGHAVGNHSWSHPSFLEISHWQRWAEVRHCQRVLGLKGARLFRPPRGHQNFSSRLDLIWLRYRVIGWNVASQDWLEHTPTQIADMLLQRIQPGSIVLLHDAIYKSRQRTPQYDRQPMIEAVNMVLTRLSSQYRFVTIPELLTYGRPVYKYWTRHA